MLYIFLIPIIGLVVAFFINKIFLKHSLEIRCYAIFLSFSLWINYFTYE